MCGGMDGWGSWLGPTATSLRFPCSSLRDEIDGRHSSSVRAAELQIQSVMYRTLLDPQDCAVVAPRKSNYCHKLQANVI